MFVRQIITFENSLTEMAHLVENYDERRGVDSELGNSG